jgi:drug/metabolite transporter (DMT)-like permease
MLWVYLAITAYFLNAVVFSLDKFLLAAPIPNPLSYAFYTAVLDVLAAILLVAFLGFAINLPAVPNLAVILVSGLTFFGALIFLFKSVRAIDVLEAAPTVGAISVLTAFFASIVLLNQRFSGSELTAFFLLAAGILMLSFFHLGTETARVMLVGGMLFGVSAVTLKLFFTTSSFINGLFWFCSSTALGSIFVLAVPRARRQIFSSFSLTLPSSKLLFLFAKALAALASFVLYYAIKIGNVVFVNALQGLQYVFIFLFCAVFAGKLPTVFDNRGRGLWRKAAAVILIAAGLFMLFV